MENKPSGGRFIAALLFFATTAGIAILLLLTALVIWLSSVTGSFIASALIAGGFFSPSSHSSSTCSRSATPWNRSAGRPKRFTRWPMQRKRATNGSPERFLCF